MKKIIFIVVLFVSACFSVACADNNPIVQSSKEYEIIFDFCNVDTIIYYDDDDAMAIHYDDADVFDYENLAYLTDRNEWYGEYVSVYVDDTIITEFLNDYYKYLISTEYDERMELSYKYVIIEEDIKYNNGERDIIFFIRANTEQD